MSTKPRVLSRATLLRWLREERECVLTSFREIDGVVRDRSALADFAAIDALTDLVKRSVRMPRRRKAKR